MEQTALPFLSGWQNFYVIAGAAAATLTGLMFVAATLIAGIERQSTALDAGISGFNTPTMVHFGMVLLMAGILSAPWPSYLGLSILLGLEGLGGGIYLIFAMRIMRNVPGYQTPLKDWLWYGFLPFSAYVVLIIAAIALPANPALVLYFISAVMVVLLFIGIHNAWDLVIFLATERTNPNNRG